MRANLFHINGGAKEPLSLPDPVGASVTLSDKVYVPVKEHPEVSNATRWELCRPRRLGWSSGLFELVCSFVREVGR